jgi:hypothetical protein
MTDNTPEPPENREREYTEDPALNTDEKQFSIVGVKSDERLCIYSEIGSVTRRVMNHPEATIEETREVDGTVVAVKATIPRSVLTIKSKSRSSDGWSDVISGGVL